MDQVFWTLPRDDRCLLLYILSIFRVLVQQCSLSISDLAAQFLPHLVSLTPGKQMALGEASAMAAGLTVLIMAHPGFLSRPIARSARNMNKGEEGKVFREELRRWQQEARSELVRSESEVVMLQTVRHAILRSADSYAEEMMSPEIGSWEVRREI
ncbi:hypothetical protein EX30DRAFT_342844 [Ascodesmis nigricans]|uniref:Uncharacterized protein n=1 Tax=Ascodesmis nigricans TaxID=341454 RepID=A0A4V3SI56_9PEZI|nr:hypothetical protein EX30DRAFT_342844 [Ascodesmis nigricans]